MEYTGHPFIDIGIATITAFAGRQHPTNVTIADMEKISDYMEENYVIDPLKSFLNVAFPNSGFTQAAYNQAPQKRTQYAQKILRVFYPDTPTLPEKCVFTGKPVVALSLDLKDELPLGRAYRQHIPLITGEQVINFHPNGESGLPVSGEALLALQAFPLGCAKVEGRLLAIHADDPNTTFRFVRYLLNENRKAIQVAQISGEKKLPEPARRMATLLIEMLLRLEQERIENLEEGRPVSITAYHLSNSGQGAALDIYHLPMEINDFLITALTAPYRQAWDKIRRRGWQIVEGKHTKKNRGKDGDIPQPSFNVLYEDILKLPGEAVRFIRRYFLRIPGRSRLPGDPRNQYSLRTEADLVSWNLTVLFLKKVVAMDKTRIEQIRNLGDVLAEHIQSENDRKFFYDFLTVRRYDSLRAAIIKVNVTRMKRSKSPVVGFDAYIQIFEQGEELPYSDWRLARDLVLIRMVERLFHLGWIQANQEELPEPEVLAEE